jgi:hypothetical protein
MERIDSPLARSQSSSSASASRESPDHGSSPHSQPLVSHSSPEERCEVRQVPWLASVHDHGAGWPSRQLCPTALFPAFVLGYTDTRRLGRNGHITRLLLCVMDSLLCGGSQLCPAIQADPARSRSDGHKPRAVFPALFGCPWISLAGDRGRPPGRWPHHGQCSRKPQAGSPGCGRRSNVTETAVG